MFIAQLTVNIMIFMIGLFGVCLNYRSILITLMGIELMLLSTSLNFAIFSVYLNDIVGEIFCLLILTVAAAASAIGLGILILLYKTKGSIDLNDKSLLKK
jgi:NADH-quinone oxidoreductase subunit K